jgi:hypothetical protein
MDLFSLPLFMDKRNGLQLQLIECIESMKSDVKRKMTLIEHSSDALKSHKSLFQENFPQPAHNSEA